MKKILYIFLLLLSSELYSQVFDDSVYIIVAPYDKVTRAQVDQMLKPTRRPWYFVFEHFRIDSLMPAGSLFRDTSGVFTLDTSGNPTWSAKRYNLKYKDWYTQKNMWIDSFTHIDSTYLKTYILNHDQDSLFSSKMSLAKFPGYLLKYKTEIRKVIDSVNYFGGLIPVDTVWKDTLIYVDSLGLTNLWNDTSGTIFFRLSSSNIGYIKLDSGKMTYGLSDSNNIFILLDTSFHVVKSFSVGSERTENFKVDTSGNMVKIRGKDYSWPTKRIDSIGVDSILGLFVLRDSLGTLAFDSTIVKQIKGDSIDSIKAVRSNDTNYIYLYQHNKVPKFAFFKRDSIDSIRFVRDANNNITLNIYEHGKSVKSDVFLDSVLVSTGIGMTIHDINGAWHNNFPLDIWHGGTGKDWILYPARSDQQLFKYDWVNGLFDTSGIYVQDILDLISGMDTSQFKRKDDSLYPGGYTTRYETHWWDSYLATLITYRLLITDTTNMLANYLDGKDTVYLRNDLGLKLNKTDSTATYHYARNWQINYLTNYIVSGLALKLNISDTSSMLTNYRHWLSGYLKGVDTVSLSNRINLKQNIIANLADTLKYKYKNDSTAGTGYARNWQILLKQDIIPNLPDTSKYWEGTSAVTSIASGNGMNFSTITGTGTVTLGTPSSITATSLNSLTTTSHTHAITKGTFTETIAGLELSATRNLIGGSAVLSLSSGYYIPLITDTLNYLKRSGGNVYGTVSMRNLEIYDSTGAIYNYWRFLSLEDQYLQFLQNGVEKFKITSSSVNIPTGSTYDINGVPHTHGTSGIDTTFFITKWDTLPMLSNYKDKGDSTLPTGYTPLWKLNNYLPLTGGTISGTLHIGEEIIFDDWGDIHNIASLLFYGGWKASEGLAGSDTLFNISNSDDSKYLRIYEDRIDIPSGYTYNIGGVPHTHGTSGIDTTFFITKWDTSSMLANYAGKDSISAHNARIRALEIAGGGGVTGSGVSTQLAVWTGTNTLTHLDSVYWSSSGSYLHIQGVSGQTALNVGGGSISSGGGYVAYGSVGLTGTLSWKDYSNNTVSIRVTGGIITNHSGGTWAGGEYRNDNLYGTIDNYKNDPDYAEFLEFKKYKEMKKLMVNK